MRETSHRKDHGRVYDGLSIHAASGVHEHAAQLCTEHLVPGSSILEVGAGSGALAKRLIDLGYEVTATDLEPSADWIQELDLNTLSEEEPFGSLYDMVLCVETLEHLENPRAALRAMRHLLEPGGMILVSTPNVSHPHSRVRNLLKGAPFLFGADAYYDTGHITPLPDWLLLEHLNSAGFHSDLIEHAGDFGFATPRRKRLHHLEMWMLSALGITQDHVYGDGVCIFILAKV